MKSIVRRATRPDRWLGLFLFCLGAPALAQGITVANLNDPGAGSLRRAVLDPVSDPAGPDVPRTTLGGVCSGFTFPYTLSGADNTARVAELRQAIECANLDDLNDDIDLDGQTLVFSDGPYSDADGPNALPIVTGSITLMNGTLERDASAAAFRFLKGDSGGPLHLGNMRFRNGHSQTDGGAILADYVFQAGATRFENNRAEGHGGALRLRDAGGGALLIGLDFRGNAAIHGAALSHDSLVTLLHSRIEDNGDAASLSVLHGSTGIGLIGVLIANNQLPATGSALFHYENPVTNRPELRHVTVANNSVAGMLFHSMPSSSIAYNSIIWGNTLSSLGMFTADRSIVQNLPPNPPQIFSQPPGFVDAANGDFRLASGSPAIDASLDGYLFPDMFDLDGDGDSSEMMPDLDLANRPYDDPDVVNTGTGNAVALDMGAFERQIDSAVAGITVNPDSGLVTGEDGNSDTFTVVLDRYPAADVTMALSSSDTGEGTVSPASLVFTQANWNAPQTVTVTGVDDALVDGDVGYSIATAAAVSADPDYNGLNPPDVSVTNIDDDSICDSYSFPYTLSGADNTARVAALRQAIECANANATDDVIDLAGHVISFDDLATDPALPPVTSGITLRNGELQGTGAALRALTFIGIESNGALAVAQMTFRHGATAIYNEGELDVADSDFIENGQTGSGEGGAIASNGYVLRIIDSLFAGNEAELGGAVFHGYGDLWLRTSRFENNHAVEGGALFTLVSIRLLGNDFVSNGADKGGAILSSTGGGYISGGHFDRNRADTHGGAVAISGPAPGPLSLSNSLFTGNEAPTGSVLTHAGVGPVLRNVTISGHMEGLAGSLFASGTPGATSRVVNSILWGNGDTPVGSAAVAYSVVEGGFPTGVHILDTDPRFIDPVTGNYRPGEGSPAIDAGSNADVATDTWMDIDEDGDFDEELDDLDGSPRRHDDAGMADTGSGTAPIVDMGAHERQTDSTPAGIAVIPTAGLTTTEAGGTATFTVVLDTRPNADVSIGLSSSDSTEGTVAPANVIFTAANWNTAQTVTVTGVDDGGIDGDIAYSIVTAAAVSDDGNYSGFDSADVSVTNTDDDVAGITVAPAAGLTTSEAGGTAIFTVVLGTQPSADVSIGLSSSDTTEGFVSPAGVTFTTANWSVAQTVTVTGVDDSEVDGDVVYTIVAGAAASADANYDGIDASDVSVTNTDNDSAGITVAPTGGLSTTEAGGSATFTVVLESQPSADVAIPLSSSDTTEGTVSPASLTFTAANWNIAQMVTVTGVDDNEVDDDVVYMIVTGAATSADANYDGVDTSDVSVTSTDNDSAGITIAPTSGLITTEAGSGATFTVVLDSQPSAAVTLPLSSSDTTEGAISPASLTFTAANWNIAQMVTVTGVDDNEVDDDVVYMIVTGAATSADANYDGVAASDVSVTNADNDSAGITIAPAAGLVTSETGGMATFTVVLDSAPTSDVTIGLSSSDSTEGTVSPPSLSFNAANWNVARIVTVTGVDDSEVDGDIAYSIVTGAATSGDTHYNGMDAADVSSTNTDDDVAGAHVAAFKSVIQAGTVQQPVIYDIQLVNLGSGDQLDDPAGDELVDVLPSELALRAATADAGAVSVDLSGNTVRWNGVLAADAAPVTIRIEADVVITQRATIYNQATIAYDADGDGSNDTPGLSTDPSQSGADVPTAFEFAGGTVAAPSEPIRVPADNRLALTFLALILLIAAFGAMRRQVADT